MQLFEDLLPKLGNYEIKVFKPWLYRVAKNHCLQLLRKENKEIPLDYTINIMESDEFLHLLSEEESSEDRLKGITSLSRKVARRTTDEHYTFLFRGNVVCGYCRADRITLNNVKAISRTEAKLKNLYQETNPMRLSDYIQGLRKGKEAHRLEKESMKDPFLADAIDGYNQVEGNHEQRIEQLRIQISARSTKKRNTYAIIWSVAACLVIGFGISSYFLFLKETPEPVIPIIPQKEIALVPTKTKTDSTPISPVSTKQADKKDIIAKSRTTIPSLQVLPLQQCLWRRKLRVKWLQQQTKK